MKRRRFVPMYREIIEDIYDGARASDIMSHIYDLTLCHHIREVLVATITTNRTDLIPRVVEVMREKECSPLTHPIAKAIADNDDVDTVIIAIDAMPEIVSAVLHIYSSRGQVDRIRIVRSIISSS